MYNLEEMERTLSDKQRKHYDYLKSKRNIAKEYTDHISDRLELLKIMEIVKKIDTENKFIDKI
jgi:hypothetical protein